MSELERVTKLENQIESLKGALDSRDKTISKLQKKLNKLRKKGVTEEDKYRNLVKVNEKGYVVCEEHGAILQVNKDGTLYRCPECNIGIDVENIFSFVERQVFLVKAKIREDKIKELTT